MKQYLSPEQTAKLIELGLLPKHIQKISDDGKLLLECVGYSIGELIEMLPATIVDEDSEYSTVSIYYTIINWVVEYSSPKKIFYTVLAIELIDALYDMVVKLKEKEVI